LVHDLIPITHPQFCRAGEEVRHRRRMSSVLDIACGVVTNSADTLKTLSDFAGAEGRLLPSATVAWPGVPAMPAVSQLASAEPIFVVLGTIEARKNHAMLLELWRRMIDSADGKPLPQLVIVGRRGWQAEGVFARLDSGEFGDRVIEVGPADDLRLAELLATARALLFPSHAEGFGMPLVEALAAGVPVLASDLPAFREIGQDVPEFLPTDDLAAWGEAVADYANEASVRRTAQLERLERFHAPDWERHFAKIDTLLNLLG
jgi:glycosyltransferase involved in cell wall biosynthesis